MMQCAIKTTSATLGKGKRKKREKNKQQREIHLLKQPRTWKSRTGRDSSESNMKSVQK